MFFLGAGCSSIAPPVEEFSLAKTALQYAKRHGAHRYAPTEWHKAFRFYQRGESFYKGEAFEQALENFEQAIFYAEEAENKARVKKYKSEED